MNPLKQKNITNKFRAIIGGTIKISKKDSVSKTNIHKAKRV